MTYIKEKFFLIVTIILTQLFFACIFLSNESLLLESRMLYYRQVAINEKYESNFIHATMQNQDNSISQQMTDFVRKNTSCTRQSVIYHELFSNEVFTPKLKTKTGEYYSTASKLLYNPYRYDLNRKYFESFRLRQEFQDVDSRYFDSKYDFTIQVPNTLANNLLFINGINDNFNYFKNNRFEIEIAFNDQIFSGFISNIFYIENTEPISLTLEKYHGQFSIIVPSSQMQKSLNKRTHFDFVNTSLRTIKEMKKISTLTDYNTDFQDNNGNSEFLANTMTIIRNNNFNYLKLVLYSLLFTTYLGLSIFLAVKLFKKKALNYYTIMFLVFISAIIYSTFLFFMKKVFFGLFTYNLGNIYSGFLSALVFVSFFIITFYKFIFRKEHNV